MRGFIPPQLLPPLLFIPVVVPFRPVAVFRVGFSFRSWRTPWRSLIRETLALSRLHALPWRAECRHPCRCSRHATKGCVRRSLQLHLFGIFRLSPCPSPSVLHHDGTPAARVRVLPVRAYTYFFLCRLLGFYHYLRMLLSFGGLSLSLSVHVCGKPPSPGGSHYPPVAPGGGSSFVRFRTAAHAAKPPPSPPEGGSRKNVSRRVFGCLLCVCVRCVSLRFLSVFSPFLSLLGCRSFCHGSSRYALHFWADDLSDFLPRQCTAAICRRKHARRHIVRFAGRFIIFSTPRTIYQIIFLQCLFCLQIACKRRLKSRRWY